MGSQAPLPPTSSRPPIHVLVTGFGPFRDTPLNPSFLIASALPLTLATPSGRPIHIHAHPSAVPVSYAAVRELVPALLFPASKLPSKISTPPTSGTTTDPSGPSPTHPAKPNFDLTLLIGVAPGRGDFSLETQARRDGYGKEDVRGATWEGDTLWKRGVGEGGYAAPEILGTGVEGGEVWRRWRGGLPDLPLRLSTDAGHYLCEFIYYTGLVEYWRRDPKGERPVLFLHVPKGVEAEDVDKGRRVAEGLIQAVVGSWEEGGKHTRREAGKQDVEDEDRGWVGS
ncbi:hypothetical protein MMC18_006858 [Xylographa bjoerkii]|nr:hypothetical protein [Xylographa bjoerkii]